MENTHSDGFLVNTGERTKRNYTGLFPSISLSIDLPRGNQNISLDIERDIRRPWYFRSTHSCDGLPTTPTQKGNPYLSAKHCWYGIIYYRFYGISHFMSKPNTGIQLLNIITATKKWKYSIELFQ